MNVDAYLERIGADRTTGLRDLHRLHQETIPFENLSIHLGERISLEPDDLSRKIVENRRGGFCYELNGAFALVLEQLGHDVTRLACRVNGGDHLGPPFDHLTLLVDGQWLVDVGFGAHSTYPLNFETREPQPDPGGLFTIKPSPEGDVDVLKDGRLSYRIETKKRDLSDFVPTCWWQQTSPDSHFTRNTICTRLDGDARLTISGRKFIRTKGDSRTEEALPTDDALLAAYRESFGITLDRVPGAAR
ncbi:arylamine N-acetyltransferase family protein [Actinoplanes sp. CA-142083]|uniref:arylamine N-acetyltransferase family protein n=1 Tax=Actinoplanes sp. CA-142083 TaxID=3239903 RepID=UPI003D915FC2